MSTHNIGFHEDLTKISLSYHQISSNTHLISSAGTSPLSGVDGILVLKNPHKMILKWFTPGIFVSLSVLLQLNIHGQNTIGFPHHPIITLSL